MQFKMGMINLWWLTEWLQAYLDLLCRRTCLEVNNALKHFEIKLQRSVIISIYFLMIQQSLSVNILQIYPHCTKDLCSFINFTCSLMMFLVVALKIQEVESFLKPDGRLVAYVDLEEEWTDQNR